MKKIIRIVSLIGVVGCAMGVMFHLQKQWAPEGKPLTDRGPSLAQQDVMEPGTLTAEVLDDRSGKTEAIAQPFAPSKDQPVGSADGGDETSQKIEIAQPPQEKHAMEVAEPVVEAAAANEDPALIASGFMEALRQAVTGADIETINSVLDKTPQSAECTDLLKRLVADANSSAELCRYANEALARIGSQESVACLHALQK